MTLFGYFGGAADYTPIPKSTIAEIRDHCNLGVLGSWACNSGDPMTLANWHINQMKAGIAAGIKQYITITDVLVYQLPSFVANPTCELNLRVYFAALRDAGVLDQLIGVYPVDEPNGIISDAQVLETNAAVRKVWAEFSPRKLLLCVCYGGLEQPTWWQLLLGKWLGINKDKWVDKSMPLVGISDYDVVGGDDYPQGADILPQYDRLLSRLGPLQKVMLFPGGCSPWRQDLAPFTTWAQAHADRTFAICPFTWFDREGMAGSGIRNNGMADVYRAAGKLLCEK